MTRTARSFWLTSWLTFGMLSGAVLSGAIEPAYQRAAHPALFNGFAASNDREASLHAQSVASMLLHAPVHLQGACDLPNVGAATTEGVQQMHVDTGRTTYTVDGTGIKVGIISNSFDIGATAAPTLATRASDDVVSGDLPGPGNPCGRTTPVTVVREYPASIPIGNADEGRAMAQIVHDIAPGAALLFASSAVDATHLADVAGATQMLRDAGANVIVDDSADLELFFQDDPADRVIADFVQHGGMYITAAGNLNRVVTLPNGTKKNSSSYQANYRSMPCPTLINNGTPLILVGDCHDFDPGTGFDSTFNYSKNGGAFIDFQYAEPTNAVVSNFDVYIIDPSGNVIAAGTTDNLVSQIPSESLAVGPSVTNFSVIINRKQGRTTPLMRLMVGYNANVITSAEYLQPDDPSTSPDQFGITVTGHRMSANTLSIAAVPYNDSTQVEDFSSRGQPTVYYTSTLGTTPAQPFNPPQTRAKPEVAATDGGANTFFGRAPNSANNATAFWRFAGTSASAPHAAGVAALLFQRSTTLGITPTQALLTDWLEDSALDLPAVPVEAKGHGLIQVDGALARINTVAFSAPSISIPETQATALLTVTLATTATVPVSVNYAVTGGTATQGTDYTLSNGSLSFAVGERTKAIPITIIDNTVVAPNKTVIISLSDASGAFLVGNKTIQVTIVNDDQPVVTVYKVYIPFVKQK